MENERLAYIYSVAFDEGYDKGYQDGKQEEREIIQLQLNQLLEKLKNGGANK